MSQLSTGVEWLGPLPQAARAGATAGRAAEEAAEEAAEAAAEAAAEEEELLLGCI